MKKNDFCLYNEQAHRILSDKEDKALVINCEKVSMPFWVDRTKLKENSEKSLVPQTATIDSLSPPDRKTAYQRYSLIAPVLPFVEDEYMRSKLIAQISENEGVSKQTIRKYLCLFLAHQDVGGLAPCKSQKRPLSQDEKNFRRALNKYYYSPLKHTLKGSYMLMLKECYTTSGGVLKGDYPPFHRYRYFFNKTKKMQSLYISRNGLTNYQRNNRPLVGGGVLEFANSIGVGMLDSTILDIYLVNDAGELIGRPILTACVDAYSGLCCGYSLTWEGGVFSIKQLLYNIITDKVAWCKRFGITITKEQWNCSQLPMSLVTDKGKEYTSFALEQLTDLGVKITNLPPFRPDLKSCVEQFFNVIQNLYKPHLKGKGVVEKDFQERGALDYRKTACLTLKQFETILLKCIIYYNTKRIVERCPFDKENPQKPYANEIWNSSLDCFRENLISVDKEIVELTLLPRAKATFTRKGLQFKKLYYHSEGFTNEYLKGGTVTIAYNPDRVANVWLMKDGGYISFALINSFSEEDSFESVAAEQMEKKQYLKSFEAEETEARVSLIGDIEAISNLTQRGAKIHSTRRTRSKEKVKERGEASNV